MKHNTHTHSIRVYYEDTDAGGVVYYANYLKFAERARTELLRERGIEQAALAEKEGIYFVVRNATLDLRRPARLDDKLNVETTIKKVGGASIEMQQNISCENALLAVIEVKIASIAKNFSPKKMPPSLRTQFA